MTCYVLPNVAADLGFLEGGEGQNGKKSSEFFSWSNFDGRGQSGVTS